MRPSNSTQRSRKRTCTAATCVADSANGPKRSRNTRGPCNWILTIPMRSRICAWPRRSCGGRVEMRIGVNALYLIPGGVGGTEIYLRSLLEAMARIDRENHWVVFTNRETGEL